MRALSALRTVTAIGLIVAAGPATGSAAELDGFGPFTFGAALKELQQAHELEIIKDTERKTVARVARTHTVIGYDFSAELYFRAGSLREIWISTQHPDSDLIACQDHFDTIFGALDAEYGPPDNTPTRDVDSVRVHTDYMRPSDLSDRDCETFVVYKDRAGNTGF